MTNILLNPKCDIITIKTMADSRTSCTCWTTCVIQCGHVCCFQNHYPGRWACKVSSSPSPPVLSFPSPRLCCGARAETRTQRCRLRSNPPKRWWWCAGGPCTPATQIERTWETCSWRKQTFPVNLKWTLEIKEHRKCLLFICNNSITRIIFTFCKTSTSPASKKITRCVKSEAECKYLLKYEPHLKIRSFRNGRQQHFSKKLVLNQQKARISNVVMTIQS